MAQRPKRRGGSLGQVMASLNEVFEAAKTGRAGMDDFGDWSDAYWSSPEKIMANDQYVAAIINYFLNALFVDGFIFIRGRKIFHADAVFEPILNTFYLEFAYDAFVFLYARGYLVWYRETRPDGVTVPRVPNYDDIKVNDMRDQKTDRAMRTVEWKSMTNKTQLYLMDEGMPFTRGSFLAQSLSVLKELHNLDRDRSVGSKMASEPPFVLESTLSRQKPVDPEHTPATNPLIALAKSSGEVLARDSLANARLSLAASQAIVDKHASMATNATYGIAVPPGSRTAAARERPPETRFSRVIDDFQVARVEPGKPDPAYLEVKKELLAELHLVNGIPPTAILAPDSKHSATGVVEWNQVHMRQTLRMWQTLFARIMTNVLRIIHAPEDLALAEVKPTYAEDNRRVIDDTAEEMPLEKIMSADFASSRVRMELKSTLMVAPGVPKQLYDGGSIAWDVAQRLEVMAAGLPDIFVDNTVKPPTRACAVENEPTSVKPKSKSSKSGGASAAKKASAKK